MRVKLLSDEQIIAIERVLARGDRVEIIPTKDGVRLVKIARRNIKTESPEQ